MAPSGPIAALLECSDGHTRLFWLPADSEQCPACEALGDLRRELQDALDGESEALNAQRWAASQAEERMRRERAELERAQLNASWRRR